MIDFWDQAHRDVATEYEGAIRLVVGDSYFLTFPTCDAAVQAILKLQSLVSRHVLRPDADRRLSVAAGLDRGTLNIYRTAIFGRAASRASILCNLAEESAESVLLLMTMNGFSALGHELQEQCREFDVPDAELRRHLEHLQIAGVMALPRSPDRLP
jgi:hypothetical protein